MSEFIKNIPGNGSFLYSAFNNFTNVDIINLLNKQGIETKVERGDRVFPSTDNSQDVLSALVKKLKELNVKIYKNTKVEKIVIKNNKVTGVETDKFIPADKIILATGGMSYSLTGSTGDRT